MNDYYMNPFGDMPEIPDMKEMTQEEKEEVCLNAILYGCVMYVLMFVVLFVVILLAGCTTTRMVTVPEVHEIHHHHSDSIYTMDSVIIEKETTIMQLDSEAMAQYGIKLKAAESAWIVRIAEFERKLQQFDRLTQERDTVRDSIPLPYPVYVEKSVDNTQRFLILVGAMSIISIIVFFAYKVKRFLT